MHVVMCVYIHVFILHLSRSVCIHIHNIYILYKCIYVEREIERDRERERDREGCIEIYRCVYRDRQKERELASSLLSFRAKWRVLAGTLGCQHKCVCVDPLVSFLFL